jgi:hypothetical protein
MFLSWTPGNLCLLFNVKFHMKGYVLPTLAIIVAMSLGVVVSVVNGRAWDKDTN